MTKLLPDSTAATLTSRPTDESSLQYVVLIGALLLLLAAGGLGGLFYATSYEQVRALSNIVYNDEGFYRLGLPITPARFLNLRVELGVGILSGLFLFGMLTRSTQHVAGLRAELRQAGHRLAKRWHRWPLSAKLIAINLIVVLAAIRTWYLLNYPLGTDEVASYDYFVRDGLVAITSYYPIPNNHIFYNLLARPLAMVGLSPRLVMRLPTLVFGTCGTLLGYLLLARITGLRLATLVTGLVGLVPIWVYYAAVGRGYFIQFCLLQVGAFAVVELLRANSAYWRLSWLAFLSSSILGLYTIPTYVYPLVSLMAALGLGYVVQRRWVDLRALLVAGIAIVVITLVLYAPLVTVSGWHRLVANRYVATRTTAQFWPPFRAIMYETAADLFGPSLRLSGPLWLAAALLGGVTVRRWLPAGPRRLLGYVAWAMLATPLVLMALQRVYAPLRTVLYLTFFGYLLAALLLTRLPGRQWLSARMRWPLLVLFLAGVGTARLYHYQTQVQTSQAETQLLQQAYRWLRQYADGNRRPTQVWLDSPIHELFFAHYQQQNATRCLLLNSGGPEGPSKPYDLVVLDNYYSATAMLVKQHYHAVYHDRLVTIYAVNP